MKLPRFRGGAQFVDEIKRRVAAEPPRARLHIKHRWQDGFRLTEVLAVDEETGDVLCMLPVVRIDWMCNAGDYTYAQVRFAGAALEASLLLDNGEEAELRAVPQIPGRRAKSPDVSFEAGGKLVKARGTRWTLDEDRSLLQVIDVHGEQHVLSDSARQSHVVAVDSLA